MFKCDMAIDDVLHLVRIKVSGELGTVAGGEIIRNARLASTEHKYNILYDMRDSILDATVTDFYQLARNREIFDDPEMIATRVGILAPPGGKANYKFYETTARNMGLRVKVATDEQELLNWLAGEE